MLYPIRPKLHMGCGESLRVSLLRSSRPSPRPGAGVDIRLAPTVRKRGRGGR